MPNSMADQFMQALQEAERTMDPAPVATLFSDDAELSSLVKTEPYRGQEAAQTFWQEYLSVFQQIRSDFTHVIERDGAAVLEWISEGALRTGEPIRYRGVSILEVEGERVKRFRTYYDSGVFLPGGAKHSPAQP